MAAEGSPQIVEPFGIDGQLSSLKAIVPAAAYDTPRVPCGKHQLLACAGTRNPEGDPIRLHHLLGRIFVALLDDQQLS